jgi:demethylmenaquinone methyltransferase / 2-methoxy-6-polyprenyl-1,4-benzoquinol methylase
VASYDRIVNLCTFGMDTLWKNRIPRKIPQTPTDILDLACGTGILTFKLASAFPSARILAVDVTPEYLEIARMKAAKLRTGNVEFILSRAEDIRSDQEFDCIVSSYLAKYADLGALTANARQMLRRHGILIAHDFTYPENRPFARLWQLYFQILKTAGASRYPEWRAAFEGLPDLLQQSKWVSELKACLYENGFSSVTEQRLTLGTAAIVSATGP